MRKIHCDICEEQIDEPTNTFEESIVRNGKRYAVKIAALEGSDEYNQRSPYSGDLCRDCLWSIVDSVDPRPRAAEAATA